MKRIMIKGILAAGMMCMACVATAELRSITPAKPDKDWTKGWWDARHEQKMKLVREGGAPIVFVGDSITHFWESTGAATWNKYFKEGHYRALNLGFSGDRTEHVLWRIQNGELDGYKARAIVLMLGTNNTGHFPYAEETPEDTLVGMKTVIEAIRTKQPQAKLLLLSIFPCGATPQASNRRRNAVVNKELRRFADGKNIFWIDFSDKFMTADGKVPTEIMPDHLHPAAIGYEIWASEILPYLDFALAENPAGTMPNRFPAFISTDIYAANEPLTAIGASAFPKEICWWDTRCAETRAKIVANTNRWFDMVFAGDSITHRWERPGGGGEKVWAELLKTYSILNLGYGGDRTQHLIWRLENGELEGYKTKLFMLMIGTNNYDSPANIAAGIRKCITLMRTKHPEAKVLLLPIFPCGATANDNHRKNNEAVNRIIRSYADGKDVLWLDFNDKFLDKDGKMLPGVMFPDNLHPDHNGYLIWRDATRDIFRAIVGK